MIESNQDLFPESKRGEWIRLRTMIFIRWVAISGQLAAIVTAFQYFELALNLSLCFFAVGLSAFANVVASLLFPESKSFSAFFNWWIKQSFFFSPHSPCCCFCRSPKKKIHFHYRFGSRFHCNSPVTFLCTFRKFIWKNFNYSRYFLIWKLDCNKYWNCIFGFLFNPSYVGTKHNE